MTSSRSEKKEEQIHIAIGIHVDTAADFGHEISHPQLPHMELELNVAREDVMA